MLGSLLAIAAGALIAPWLWQMFPRQAGRVLALLPLACFLWFVSRISSVADGEVLAWSLNWVSALDVSLSLRLDGLSLVFALLITGIGALIVLYAANLEQTLESVLAERGPLGPEEAMRIGRDICRGLAALQNAGVIHRDHRQRDTGARRDRLRHRRRQGVHRAGTPALRAGDARNGDNAGTAAGHIAPAHREAPRLAS